METRRKEKLVWANGGAMRKAVWKRNGIWTGRGSRKEELKHSWVQRKSGEQEAVADLKHGPKISLSSPLEMDVYPLFLSLGSVTAWPKDYGRSDTVTVSRIKP